MRITYLHQYFNTPDMAGGTRSYEMARRLVARGHEVHMITSWRQENASTEWFETVEEGIRVHWLPVPYSNNMSPIKRIQAFFRFAWAAARKAASVPSDVVFASSTPLTIALPGAFAKWWINVPLVFEVRDLWPDVPYEMGVVRSRILLFLARVLERFAYQVSERIVVLTPTMADFLSGKGVSLKRINVIPNVVDLSDFAPEPNAGTDNKRGGHRLLYCGGMGPAHGPDFLVDLAVALNARSANVCIQVLGNGPLLEKLKGRAEELGVLDKEIVFYGKVPKKAISSYYKEAHASIMTICNVPLLYRHSVQNKFFDSMAAGRPVFANYRGWASEVAESAGAGWILDSEDIQGAADKICKNLGDSEALSAAQAAARRLAERRFDADILAKELEDVLTDAVSHYGKPRGEVE